MPKYSYCGCCSNSCVRFLLTNGPPGTSKCTLILLCIYFWSRGLPRTIKRKAGSIKSVKMREHSVNPAFSGEILCVLTVKGENRQTLFRHRQRERERRCSETVYAAA